MSENKGDYNQKMFEEFLKSFDINYYELSTSEIEEWYTNYLRVVGSLLEESSQSILSFLDKDFNDESFEEYLQINGAKHLEKLMFYLTDPVFMEKFNMFVDRHNMKLNIYLDKENGEVLITEQWSSDVGILLSRKYFLNSEIYATLVEKVRKKIISKKVEMSYPVEDYEILGLSYEDKIKYYEYQLKLDIEKENFESAAKIRDLLDELKM